MYGPEAHCPCTVVPRCKWLDQDWLDQDHTIPLVLRLASTFFFTISPPFYDLILFLKTFYVLSNNAQRPHHELHDRQTQRGPQTHLRAPFRQ